MPKKEKPRVSQLRLNRGVPAPRKRGLWSSEETVERFDKLEKDVDARLKQLETRLGQVEAKAPIAGKEPFFYFGKDTKFPSIEPPFELGLGGEGTPDIGMGLDPKWRSPAYLMRRMTRLMRGGVPTTGPSLIRRILYTLPGKALLLAGILAFVQHFVDNILRAWFALQQDLWERELDRRDIRLRERILRDLEKERQEALRKYRVVVPG